MTATISAPGTDTAATSLPAGPTPQMPAGHRLRWVARGVLVVSLVVWVLSLRGLADVPLNQYGLLAARPTLLLATLGVTLAFGLAVRADAAREAVAAVLGLVAITRATACIVPTLPIFEWTYKHIGVADHLSTTGHLDRGVDIYQNWPGFFSAAAWFTDVTGVPFVDVARWFPLAVDLALVLGMYAISRAFGHPVRVALVAAFGMQLLNWVAQDYFSPQAAAFVLALPVVALLLHSHRSPRAVWFTVPLFAAITVTHQLTPYWLAGIAVLLGLTRRVRPRFVAVVYLAIAVGFAAVNFDAITGYGLLTGFDPLSNAQSNVPTAGNAGRAFTSLAARGTSALMWVAALASAWIARRRGERVWVPAVLAFTSFGLLAGQSYGGEAIFRVFLYSIPGCVLLIAPVVERALVPAPRRGSRGARARGVLRRTVVVGAVALAVCGSMQAYYGTWFINLVDRDGLVAETRLLDTAPTNSLLIPLTLGIAERPTGRYLDFAANDFLYDNALVTQPGIISSRFEPAEVANITRGLQSTDRPVYLIVSAGMRRYSTYYGLFPPGAIDRLLRNLENSTSWQTLQNTPTLTIFRLVPR